MNIELLDGKYTYTDEGLGTQVLRYGEPWRDTTGDGFILAMAQKIEELEETVSNMSILTPESDDPVIGQECVCPDGVGRIKEVKSEPCGPASLVVETYFNDRSCCWAAHNVKLIPIKSC